MTQDPSKLMFLSGTLRARPQKGGYPYMSLLQIALQQLGIEQPINFKEKTTYADMIADGVPSAPTMYSVLNDENKGYIRSTYLWKSNGQREWIASTPDN